MKMISLNLFSAVNRRMAIALLVAATAPATINAAPLVKPPFVAAVNDSGDKGNTGIITGATSIKGIDDVMGLTYDDIKALAVKAGEFNEEDMSRIISLYNVKTKMFLNAGGFWGTHVSLKDYPLPLWVNTIKGETALQLVQNMDTGEGKQLGWNAYSLYQEMSLTVACSLTVTTPTAGSLRPWAIIKIRTVSIPIVIKQEPWINVISVPIRAA